jgi:predicted PurR-regulated permease PerM
MVPATAASKSNGVRHRPSSGGNARGRTLLASLDEEMPASRLAHALLLIVAVILATYFLHLLGSVFIPFVTALIVSFFAHPMVEAMTTRRVPPWLAIGVVVLAFLALFTGIGFVIHKSVTSFVASFPRYQARIMDLRNEVAQRLGEAKITPSKIPPEVTSHGASIISSGVGSTLSFLEDLVLVMVYMVFFLLGRRSLPRRLDRAFDHDRARKAVTILEDIEHQSFRFIGLRTVLCLVTGFMVWLILELYGVEFALLFGVITFVAQYIPIVGPIAASVAPILIAFLQFPTISTGLWVGLWLTLFHLFVGYVVEPRVFGRGMHLNQALILFGLVFFAWLWGPIGALIAVPMLVILKSIADNVSALKPLSVLLGGE